MDYMNLLDGVMNLITGDITATQSFLVLGGGVLVLIGVGSYFIIREL